MKREKKDALPCYAMQKFVAETNDKILQKLHIVSTYMIFIRDLCCKKYIYLCEETWMEGGNVNVVLITEIYLFFTKIRKKHFVIVEEFKNDEKMYVIFVNWWQRQRRKQQQKIKWK